MDICCTDSINYYIDQWFVNKSHSNRIGDQNTTSCVDQILYIGWSKYTVPVIEIILKT